MIRQEREMKELVEKLEAAKKHVAELKKSLRKLTGGGKMSKNINTQLVVYSKASLRIVGLTKPRVSLPDNYALGLVEQKKDGSITSDPPGLWCSWALPETVNFLTGALLKK